MPSGRDLVASAHSTNVFCPLPSVSRKLKQRSTSQVVDSPAQVAFSRHGFRNMPSTTLLWGVGGNRGWLVSYAWLAEGEGEREREKQRDGYAVKEAWPRQHGNGLKIGLGESHHLNDY